MENKVNELINKLLAKLFERMDNTNRKLDRIIQLLEAEKCNHT